MKRFFECLVPTTQCNLRCEYCYIIQENRRNNSNANFQFSPEHIGKALSSTRLGGVSYISICGSGETLIPKETVNIAYHILSQGHYVNITTNGTLTSRFNDIIDKVPKDWLQRLHFAFSFHYLELLRTNNVDVFFDNVKTIRKAGCSFLTQVNLYDGYLPYWNEIKKIVYEQTGSYPQVALTRDEKPNKMVHHSKLPFNEYIDIGEKMNSPLFRFTVDNFMKKRKEFCYAGDWSGKLNLATGVLRSCYQSGVSQNIFVDINKPIKFEAIGKNCRSPYCINSSHFLSLGVIPSYDAPSYASLRDRKEGYWYSDVMHNFLEKKLYEYNDQYSFRKKIYVTLKYRAIHLKKDMKNVLRRVKHNILG